MGPKKHPELWKRKQALIREAECLHRILLTETQRPNTLQKKIKKDIQKISFKDGQATYGDIRKLTPVLGKAQQTIGNSVREHEVSALVDRHFCSDTNEQPRSLDPAPRSPSLAKLTSILDKETNSSRSELVNGLVTGSLTEMGHTTEQSRAIATDILKPWHGNRTLQHGELRQIIFRVQQRERIIQGAKHFAASHENADRMPLDKFARDKDGSAAFSAYLYHNDDQQPTASWAKYQRVVRWENLLSGLRDHPERLPEVKKAIFGDLNRPIDKSFYDNEYLRKRPFDLDVLTGLDKLTVNDKPSAEALLKLIGDSRKEQAKAFQPHYEKFLQEWIAPEVVQLNSMQV